MPNDKLKITGLEGRIFTGEILPPWPEDDQYWTDETDRLRTAQSKLVFDLCIAALREALGDDVALVYEEIDAVSVYDTAMIQYNNGPWEFLEDPAVAALLDGIHVALIATRDYWLPSVQ